jgi:diguanylate cyclase (GGDEF)-like protein/PAS domain S-box-containing protein
VVARQKWALFLAGGLALTALGATVGGEAPAIVTLLIGCPAVIAALSVARHRARGQARPWWCFAVSGGLFLVSGIVRFGHGLLIGVEEPYPSPADLFVFLGYGFLIAGFAYLSRLRSPEPDRDGLIDGFIVACAAATVAWASLLAPYIRDGSVPVPDRALHALLSAFTIVALAMTTRLAVGPGARTVSYYLFAATIWTTFTSEVLLTIETVQSTSLGLGEPLLSVAFTCFGAAVLHPSLSRLTDPPEDVDRPLTIRRVLLLAGALLMAPGIFIWQLNWGDAVDLPVVVTGSICLSLLVLVRLTSLVKAKERAAFVEHTLQEASAKLAAATSREQMNEAAVTAIHDLVIQRDSVRVSVAVPRTEETFEVVSSSGRWADQAVGSVIDLANVDAQVADGMRARRITILEVVSPLDIAGDQRPATAVMVSPLVSLNELRGAIVVSTHQPLRRAVRRAIEALTATVSLALESAALTEEIHRQRNERRFRTLVESSSDIVVVIDDGGRIASATPACEHLLGVTEAELIGTDPFGLVHDDDKVLAAVVLGRPVPQATQTEPIELRLVDATGQARWFEVLARDLSDEPEIMGLVVNCREISDRKETEDKLARSEARFRALVEHSSDVVAVLDETGQITFVTASVTAMLGFSPEELIGSRLTDVLTGAERAKLHPLRDELLGTGADHRLPPSTVEVRVRARDGEWHTLDATLTDLRHEEAVGGLVVNVRDVTVNRALERDLHHQAVHDVLTGLGNRALFTHRLNEVLTHRRANHLVANLFVELDDFKAVNDQLGHAMGDEVLITIAQRLRACLHPADTAARLGGDEFAVLVEAPYGENVVATVAERILRTLREPITIHDREITVTASIGVALDTDATFSAEELMRNADMAMYLAKEQGKARYEVFEEGMHASVLERLELKADLAKAIETGQLHLVYQPIVSLQTGRITGVESLVRWDHPERGRIGPDQFIPLAEDTGLIVPLGRWVMEEACQQLRAWQLSLPTSVALSMSINLSVRQLQHDAIVDEVASTLGRFGLDPSTVALEITETMLMRDTELSRNRLHELREVGVSLAVDDFGTGYSSLGYIQRFPINLIKIDRSFVDALDTQQGSSVVVESMIALAQRLGVHVVAEGIERQEQLRMLQALGCDLGQGYHFSRPVEANELADLLAQSLRDGARFLYH